MSKNPGHWAQVRVSKVATEALGAARAKIEAKTGLRTSLSQLTTLAIIEGLKIVLARHGIEPEPELVACDEAAQ